MFNFHFIGFWLSTEVANEMANIDSVELSNLTGLVIEPRSLQLRKAHSFYPSQFGCLFSGECSKA